MNVFDLFAKLSLDTSEYEEGLNDAEKSASGFGDKLATAAKVGGVAMATVGTAAIAAGKAIVDNTKEVAAYGDNIDKMSQKIGISAEAYQEWDFIAQHSGTSMESLKTSFKTLSVAAQEATDTQETAFEALGLTMDEISKMSTEDLFGTVVSRLQEMEEGTERTAIASSLLGKGAMELGALLNTSAEDTEAMRQQVHDLGGVMSNEAVKSAAAYQDSLQNMNTAMTGLKNNMISNFLPGITTVMDGLANIFSGDYDKGMDQISEGIDNLVTNITDKIPQFLEIGVKIIESIGTSIVKNLPKLIPALVKLVTNIGNLLIENLPLLLTMGIELFTQLFIGIAEALPDLLTTLIDTLVDMIPIVIDALVSALPQLIQGLITLVLGIVEALPTIIQSLIDALPTIISAIIDGLLTALPQLIQGAITLVIELVKHLPEIIMALIQAIPEIISAIVEGFAPLVESLGEIASNAITAIVDWFKELPQKVGYWFGEMAATAIKFIAELPSKIKEKLTNIVNAVKEWGPQLATSARDAVIRLQDKFMETLKSLPDKVKQIGRNIVEGLKNGIMEKWESIKNWFSGLGDGLIKGFSDKLGIASPSKVFKKLGEFTAEGFGIGFEDEWENVQRQIGDVGLNLNMDSGTIRRVGYGEPNGENPIVIENHIYLEGKSKELLKLVREENNVYSKRTGRSAFATS